MFASIVPPEEIQTRSEVVGAVRHSISCDKAVVYPILSNALRNIEKNNNKENTSLTTTLHNIVLLHKTRKIHLFVQTCNYLKDNA